MKRLRYLALFAILGISCSENDDNGNPTPPEETAICIPTNLQTHVLAFYPFSSGSIQDESGNGRHLTASQNVAPLVDREGNPQCAVGFDGTTQAALVLPSPDFLNPLPAITVSLWMKGNDSNSGNYEGLVHRGLGMQCPDRMGDWSVGLYDCNFPVAAFTHSVWGRPTLDCFDYLENFATQWAHITAVFEFTNHQLSIYYNGNLIETKNTVASCATGFSPSHIGDLYIGREFTGYMDDVILFDRALTATEIQSLFHAEPCCENGL